MDRALGDNLEEPHLKEGVAGVLAASTTMDTEIAEKYSLIEQDSEATATRSSAAVGCGDAHLVLCAYSSSDEDSDYDPSPIAAKKSGVLSVNEDSALNSPLKEVEPVSDVSSQDVVKSSCDVMESGTSDCQAPADQGLAGGGSTNSTDDESDNTGLMGLKTEPKSCSVAKLSNPMELSTPMEPGTDVGSVKSQVPSLSHRPVSNPIIDSDADKGDVSSSDATSSSDSPSSSSDEEVVQRVVTEGRQRGARNRIRKCSDNEEEDHHIPKTAGEFGIDDLPPIESLSISVPEDTELIEVGVIESFIDKLVIIKGKKSDEVGALNIDSVLFIRDRKPFGQIFEVFGPVPSPYYSVRFNSRAEILSFDLSKGESVFFARGVEECTSFVFAEKLLREKGSDASWEHNNEPGDKHRDYSDDEQERRVKAKARRHGQEEEAGEEDESKRQMKKRPARNPPPGRSTGPVQAHSHQPVRGGFGGGASQRSPWGANTWGANAWGAPPSHGQFPPSHGQFPASHGQFQADHYPGQSGPFTNQGAFPPAFVQGPPIPQAPYFAPPPFHPYVGNHPPPFGAPPPPFGLPPRMDFSWPPPAAVGAGMQPTAGSTPNTISSSPPPPPPAPGV